MNHTSCQFRDKHTVGGIVFYKHAFLVNPKSQASACVAVQSGLCQTGRKSKLLDFSFEGSVIASMQLASQ